MSIFTKIKNLFNKKKDFNKAVKEKVEENVLVEQKKFDDGLKKSSSLINDSIDEILKNFNIIDEKLEEKILETFISFDIGYHSSKKITNAIIDEIKIQNIKDSALIKEIIVDKLIIYYIQGTNVDTCLNIKKDETNVILVSGVNGVGKTTTIAKLAYFFKNKGFSICLIAADTFRAAAVEQLENWANKLQIKIFKPQKEGQDPASVVYSGMGYAKENKIDVVLCDTSGRLQNKTNLMNELKKINQIMKKFDNNQPKESLLVVDATSGQNGLFQAKSFNEIADISGIVLTKIDSSSKGGIILSIKDVLNIPIKFIGTGEKLDDLQEFDLESYVLGLVSEIKI